MLELTKSNEDYLEAIGLLSEKNGTAQVRDIAAVSYTHLILRRKTNGAAKDGR